MRAITKGPEPASLTRHRQNSHAYFDNYPDKAVLRHALVSEQRGLCCYCMGRIRSDSSSMKIEHWRCLSQYPREQLKYRNLLAACLGGEGQPQRHQHCDTRKGDGELKWNPAYPSHNIEGRLCYGTDGSIGSQDDEFNVQLTEILNLNLAKLKNQRKGVSDGIIEWFDWLKQERKSLRGSKLRAKIERECDLRTDGAGELEPYCQVAVWWLEWLKQYI